MLPYMNDKCKFASGGVGSVSSKTREDGDGAAVFDHGGLFPVSHGSNKQSACKLLTPAMTRFLYI